MGGSCLESFWKSVCLEDEFKEPGVMIGRVAKVRWDKQGIGSVTRWGLAADYEVFWCDGKVFRRALVVRGGLS